MSCRLLAATHLSLLLFILSCSSNSPALQTLLAASDAVDPGDDRVDVSRDHGVRGLGALPCGRHGGSQVVQDTVLHQGSTEVSLNNNSSDAWGNS